MRHLPPLTHAATETAGTRRGTIAIRIVAAALIALAVGVAVRGAASAAQATEQRTVPAFSAISVTGTFDLDITIGSPQSLSVTADDSALRFIETEVRPGRGLEIRTRNGFPSGTATPRIAITMEYLGALNTSGTANVTINGLNSESFYVNADGDINLYASGFAGEVGLNTVGGAYVRITDLTARFMIVNASGPMDMEVRVTNALSANLLGSGRFIYFGGPSTSVNSLGVDVSGR